MRYDNELGKGNHKQSDVSLDSSGKRANGLTDAFGRWIEGELRGDLVGPRV